MPNANAKLDDHVNDESCSNEFQILFNLSPSTVAECSTDQTADVQCIAEPTPNSSSGLSITEVILITLGASVGGLLLLALCVTGCNYSRWWLKYWYIGELDPTVAVVVGLSDFKPPDAITIHRTEINPEYTGSPRVWSPRGSADSVESFEDFGYGNIDYETEVHRMHNLGSGNFGVVYKAKLRRRGALAPRFVAVKELTRGDTLELLEEAKLMAATPPSESVVRLLGVCTSPPCMVLSTVRSF